MYCCIETSVSVNCKCLIFCQLDILFLAHCTLRCVCMLQLHADNSALNCFLHFWVTLTKCHPIISLLANLFSGAYYWGSLLHTIVLRHSFGNHKSEAEYQYGVKALVWKKWHQKQCDKQLPINWNRQKWCNQESSDGQDLKRKCQFTVISSGIIGQAYDLIMKN